DEGAEELLGLLQVRGDVVVDEEDEPLAALQRRDLRDDLVGGSARLGGAEHRLHGAELAAKMAPAARLHQPDRQIALAVENRAPWPDAGERRASFLPVELLGAAVPVVVDDA